MESNKKSVEPSSSKEASNEGLKCPRCQKIFQHKSSLCRHLKSECGSAKVYECLGCNKKFDRQDSLNRHLKTSCKGKQKNDFICETCNKVFRNNWFLNHHQSIHENKCCVCKNVLGDDHVFPILKAVIPSRKRKRERRMHLLIMTCLHTSKTLLTNTMIADFRQA